MRILVVGSGGREHALCWHLAKSDLCETLFCAPGNAGIAEIATCIPIAETDAHAIKTFCLSEEIDFVIIGPEGPLVAGLTDSLEEAWIPTFGPTKRAAILEGSKGFAKDFCARHNIPTAPYRRFADGVAAKRYIVTHGVPIVVKADGLAAGKGVTVAHTLDEAYDAVDATIGKGEIVVEDCLDGEEVSFFALVDGTKVLPLIGVQDHKAVGDGDHGANTGGMGAYSPPPCLTPPIIEEVMTRIIHPTAAGMVQEGRPFQGILFAGLMLTANGPHLIEYNVRFGDPECQVLLARLKSDLLALLSMQRLGRMDASLLEWRDEAALCVVMAAQGYPAAPVTGTEIRGLAAVTEPSVTVFHAGTRREHGRILANGGRVLGITALGLDVADAQKKAYAAIDKIDWPEGFCRRDIGWRALKRG